MIYARELALICIQPNVCNAVATSGRRELLSPMVMKVAAGPMCCWSPVWGWSPAGSGVHPALPLHESSLVEEGRQARLIEPDKVRV